MSHRIPLGEPGLRVKRRQRNVKVTRLRDAFTGYNDDTLTLTLTLTLGCNDDTLTCTVEYLSRLCHGSQTHKGYGTYGIDTYLSISLGI